MAPNQQMALTRPHKKSQTNVSRPQSAAFPTKLYEMVNDPKNSELIRWSDAGDSFFVLDHERFAREVLGRWFKHQNFSSFVRQLNMYEFHKVPHLQQGVLKSDVETEFWNFANPNFHRGQPDLLALIQRKKQVLPTGDEAVVDVRDPASPVTVPASLSSGQILDIHSIVNGIAAIKRHQTTISAELNSLKQSNQLLWQESMAARTKHQKQQDTINRIVKFLAGVFGHHAGTHKEDAVESPPSHAVVPRRPSRLMIEGRREGSGKVGITEVQDEDSGANSHFFQEEQQPMLNQYPTVETPSSNPSPSPHPSEPMTPSVTETSSLYSSDHTPIAYSSTSEQQHHTGAAGGPSQYSQPSQPHERSVTPQSPNINFHVQSALNQLTPSQIQQLLASLASQTISDPMPPPGNEQQHHDPISTSSQLTSYQPQFDFAPFMPSPSHSDSQPQPHAQPSHPSLISSPQPLPSEEHLISFDHPFGLDSRLDKSWKAAEDIDKDVNAMNNSIKSLIETFSLDPHLLDAPMAHQDGEDIDTSALDHPSPILDGVDHAMHDIDFDSLFNSISNDDGGGGGGADIDYGDSAATAFLDEVRAPPSEGMGSPIASTLHQGGSPGGGQRFRGKKRKSEGLDLEQQQPQQQQSGAQTRSAQNAAVAATSAKSSKRRK